MADLKVRPGIDKPKLRETMTAPKDAASILKKQYEAQQKEHQPGQKSPERYATDRVEGAVRGATVFAADRMRKTMQKQSRKQGQEKFSAQRRRSANGAELSRQEGCLTASYAEKHPAQPASGSTQFVEKEHYIAPTVSDAAPAKSKGIMRSMAPSAEERGRNLARTRHQTAMKRRAEAERWEIHQEFSNYQRSGDKELWRERSVSFSSQKHQDPTMDAQGRSPAKILAEKKPLMISRNQNPTKEVPQMPGRTTVKEKAEVYPTVGHSQRFSTLNQGRTPGQRGRRLAQKKAQRELLKQSAEAGKQTVLAGRYTLKETVISVGRAAAKVAGSLSTTGVVFVLTLLFLMLIAIGGLTASPFGILFAGESTCPEAVPVSAAVAQVNLAFNARLEDLQAGDYDSVTVAGSTADWVDILAVFAVKTVGTDTPDAMDVVTMDAERIEKLEQVFLDMNVLTTEVEKIHHPGGKNSPGWTERILHITITPKTAAEMAAEYRFTQQQQTALAELLEQRELLEALIGDLLHVDADARKVMEQLPENLSEERKAVIREACSLVGKVGYFWGGKSLTLGWDSRWGQLKQVTASGSPTTGTYRPYGLDCSGFVDWVFYNATKGELVLGQGGGARMQHSACRPISWDEALPGDLVFYPNDTHVGIVCGKNESGELLIVHCASGANNVVITGKQGFTTIGRTVR